MQNHLAIPLLKAIWFAKQYLYLKCGSLYSGIISPVYNCLICGPVA